MNLDRTEWVAYVVAMAMAAQALVSFAAQFTSLVWRFPVASRERFRVRDIRDVYSALSGYYVVRRGSSGAVDLCRNPGRMLACMRRPKRRGAKNPAIPLLLFCSLGSEGSSCIVEVGFVPLSLPIPLTIVLGQFLAVCLGRSNTPISKDEIAIEVILFVVASIWMAALAYYIARERQHLRASFGHSNDQA